MRRWYVPIRIHWWANAVVLKQEAPIRTRLLPDMLEVKRTDVAGHIGLWWEKVSDLAGMQVTRPMHKGDAVYSVSVKQPPMIKRGDIITIIAQVGPISVRAEGKALKSGGRGDRLLVQNLRSNRCYRPQLWTDTLFTYLSEVPDESSDVDIAPVGAANEWLHAINKIGHSGYEPGSD